jgi:hypothetical protein
MKSGVFTLPEESVDGSDGRGEDTEHAGCHNPAWILGLTQAYESTCPSNRREDGGGTSEHAIPEQVSTGGELMGIRSNPGVVLEFLV